MREQFVRYLRLFLQPSDEAFQLFVNYLSKLHLLNDLFACDGLQRLSAHYISPLRYPKQTDKMEQKKYRVLLIVETVIVRLHALVNCNGLDTRRHSRPYSLLQLAHVKILKYRLSEFFLHLEVILMHRQLHLSGYNHQDYEYKISRYNLFGGALMLHQPLLLKILAYY